MSRSEAAVRVSTIPLARPSWPLVAMITVVAASAMTALKITNLAVTVEFLRRNWSGRRDVDLETTRQPRDGYLLP
jgi:hypothetical protein